MQFLSAIFALVLITFANAIPADIEAKCGAFAENLSSVDSLGIFELANANTCHIREKSGDNQALSLIIKPKQQCADEGIDLKSKYLFQNGLFETTIKIAQSQDETAVTLIELKSADNLDSIFFKIKHNQPQIIQANYMVNGNGNDDMAVSYTLPYSAADQPVKLAIQWTENGISWTAGTTVMRTLPRGGDLGYPATKPLQAHISVGSASETGAYVYSAKIESSCP